jgi:hypothetical protein
MTLFQWALIIALVLLIAGLFAVAHAVDRWTRTFVEVMAGSISNFRRKALSVRLVEDDDLVKEAEEKGESDGDQALP